ncbi:MAG: alpha-ribazole phosphatase family protein [Bacteroidales bacterium]|nr:alpha-ribazole phosphatase family protein [Bacteroidales bacterium]
MKVILVRHTTPDVPRGTCYGWSDMDVAPSFMAEASDTLIQLTKHFPIDKAFTSPLKRARKLAEFCGFPDAEQDARLKEMNMGDWEMQPYDKIKDPALQAWYKDYMHLPATGGESFPILYARVVEFLGELKCKPFKRVAIFAHGGPIVCAGLYTGLFKEEEAFRHLVPYGGIQIIEL